ncbi:putative nuclear protein DGCR14/ESS-2 [Helianthus annuus]|uniref:Nuclear protein DGCR14/ESS-2 n=1 Tax=Helianthus annuus TaxID=4232 RepID=A0A251T7X3_HELAN|nr:putative nuclear protein DGCR14/ESS-2 [Helianthus annuus]KAJ0507773.1 putative nuclear protein DGCR14/ESS-2 [Helianthus annuus]KAJ0516192.1 putative nuclear protein DGCR14/ESS-2 [Helianthus annuus]KAJ0638502.1 putative nuclear protein DGCR14/ESS-2 [Helianthus annuus]KAJ0873780.1 putative nuclear protein DGCR14/ESS-2 [Helianthus annuus]
MGSLSLDEFFRRYTSEDNESFSKLIEKGNRNKRLRCEFLLEGENRDNGLKPDRITNGYGTSDQPLARLDGWKYTAKNLLMYHPADRGEVALTQEDFVKTPSPAPGVDESPFVTRGEIEGTPLRLEPEDTPVDIGGSGNGPQFNIPLPPSRDVKAHSLSREASRKIRDRSRMFQKPPLPSGCASPGARTLSPAALGSLSETRLQSLRILLVLMSRFKLVIAGQALGFRRRKVEEVRLELTLTVYVSLNVEAYNF